MKSFFVTFIVFFIAFQLEATQQGGDQLVLMNGRKVIVHFFTISETGEKKLDQWKKQKGYYYIVSTANDDGFYVDLKIEDNRLYLTKLMVDAVSDKGKYFRAQVLLSDIFNKKAPILANWFSGELVDYHRESKGYRSMTVYVFKNGLLVETRSQREVYDKEEAELHATHHLPIAPQAHKNFIKKQAEQDVAPDGE